ncbi:hypothetical protein ACFC0R_36055 [Streptomyces sp. NPDC056086]|uniref:hypothetical protein n=1 Tax=Streptomyces sp. NPDC056086 TaxID=3345709 RepID=UPI0035D9E32E
MNRNPPPEDTRHRRGPEAAWPYNHITEHRVERWNVATRTYEPVTSIAAAPDRTYRALVSLPLGETSYFRITGILADGTPAAVVHYSAARGDYV